MVAAATLLRVMVPAGFMPAVGDAGLTLVVCPGTVEAAPMRHDAAMMAGMAHGDRPDGAPAAPRGCAFADLAVPLIGGADAVLLAAAVAFVLALGLARRSVVPVRAAPRLRPPSQAPPALA